MRQQSLIEALIEAPIRSMRHPPALSRSSLLKTGTRSLPRFDSRIDEPHQQIETEHYSRYEEADRIRRVVRDEEAQPRRHQSDTH